MPSTDPVAASHAGTVKVNVLIAAVFVTAVILESGQDKDTLFWLIVAGGIVAVVALATSVRSRGGIGATGH
ncbi:MAG: hypothetical protein ACN4GZ_02980 [Acidimicrobiales bacterium]